MSSIEPNVMALVVFALSWTVVCFGSFLLAGMLPLGAAAQEIRQPAGKLLLCVNALLLAALFSLAAQIAYRDLRWTSIIIAAGSIFLLAPFLVQDLPERIKNGLGGLVLLLMLLAAVNAAVWLFS
jgi:hypothetical protein